MTNKREAPVWRKSPGDLVALFYAALPTIRASRAAKCSAIRVRSLPAICSLHQENVIAPRRKRSALLPSGRRACANSSRCRADRCANTWSCQRRLSRTVRNSRPGRGARSAMPLHCRQKQRSPREKRNRLQRGHPVASKLEVPEPKAALRLGSTRIRHRDCSELCWRAS